MTTRSAELLMAIVMGLLSIALMWKSTELEIGWIPDRGPGGGAWPFWLSAAMLVCCGITILRWWLRQTPESRSDDEFMDKNTRRINYITVGSLVALLGLTHIIGIYFAIFLFMMFYIRFVGRHSWLLTGILSVASPVFLFFFFEAMLKILLPKGYSEPLFYPLYKIIF